MARLINIQSTTARRDTPSATTALTLTLTVNDGGNTGSDPGLTGDPDNEEDSASQIINITAINDNPVNAGTLPVGITVTEDELSDVNLASIDLSDVDADGGALTVTLTTATGGELTAAAGTGITAGGTSTALTVTGTLTDLNAYFNTSSNIWYQHGAADLNGDNADTIQINVNDNGNTGSGGGSDVDLGTVTVDINAVNDTPVNTVPGTQSVEEEATTAITGISIADIDSAGADITTRLQVSNGVLSVTLSAGASISGGAIGTGDMTISGSVSAINATLGTLAYTGNTDVEGTSADTLVITTDDGGNIGSGGAQTDSDIVQIDITAVNDAPVVTAPTGAYAVNEQTSLAIQGTGFSVSDVDAGSGPVTATLAVGEGQLNIAEGNSGVVISGGNGSSSVELTGTLAQIDNLLTGISNGTIDYINNSDTPSATTALTLTVNDGGNTGSDAGLTGDPDNEEDSASQIINITAINDNPVNAGSLPGGMSQSPKMTLSDVNLSRRSI